MSHFLSYCCCAILFKDSFFVTNRRKPRFFSGLLTGVLSGFVTYVFLEPLFVPVGLDLAMVALWILAINATLVGLSLGVLLPFLFPGVCTGVSLALVIGCFLNTANALYFPAIAGGLALIFAIISTRYVKADKVSLWSNTLLRLQDLSILSNQPEGMHPQW